MLIITRSLHEGSSERNNKYYTGVTRFPRRARPISVIDCRVCIWAPTFLPAAANASKILFHLLRTRVACGLFGTTRFSLLIFQRVSRESTDAADGAVKWVPPTNALNVSDEDAFSITKSEEHLMTKASREKLF